MLLQLVLQMGALVQMFQKKINILNNLNFSTSYNIAADSLKLNPIRMTAGTNIFDNHS